MTSSVRRIDSVAGGPVFDWSGAWVRAVEPLAEEAPRSEAVASFLAENGGVSFVFQPIVDARRTPPSRYAVECLVRGPAGTPYEDTAHLFEFFRCRGHLAELDEFCLVAALAEGASLPGEGGVVVNVEALSVAEPSFTRRLLALAAQAGLPPERLVLDVRLGYEEAPVGKLASSVVKTRAAGIRVCYDEARASASPVRLLEVAPPDYLKLSRNVVRILWRDPWTRQCVEGALRLGEELGYRVVAQGVESARDLDAVLRCGIDLVQGFLTGPPVPRAELDESAATCVALKTLSSEGSGT